MIKEADPLLPEYQTSSCYSSQKIYTLMFLFGLASLLPWNLIITAHDFYAKKFSEVNSTTIDNNFSLYIEVVGLGSNFFAALLAVCFLRINNLKTVIVLCNTVTLLIFIVITTTARVCTREWAFSFFLMTMVLFGAVMFLSSVYMAAIMALSSILTPSAVQGFFLGQGAAGLTSAILSIITLSIPHHDPVQAGFYYFLAAAVILLLSLTAFIAFTRCGPTTAAVSEDRVREGECEGNICRNPLQSAKKQVGEDTVWGVFKKVWWFSVTTILTSTLTSVCFPAALSTLESCVKDEGSVWVSTYFLPVTVFLIFSFGDVLGRVTSSFLHFPAPSHLLPLSLLRTLLVPCILMCNLQPRTLPVWFPSDVGASVFILLLSFSNGHFISLAGRYGPMRVNTKEAMSLVGNLLSFSHAAGLLLGAVLVFPVMQIIHIQRSVR